MISRERIPPSEARAFIDRLGGSVAVSKICGVSSPAVSYWKRQGIPWYFARALGEIEAAKSAGTPAPATASVKEAQS